MSDYPDAPGSKVGGASAEAAADISGRARLIRRSVIALFRMRPRWAPDEAAAALKMHPGDVRPRFSELSVDVYDRKTGELIAPAVLRKTDARRLSHRGKSQHIYEWIDT